MGQETDMIEVSGVKKSFGGVSLLDDINFTIADGEKISLLGPGASGKSTILKMILGILSPDAGQVNLLGCDMVHAKEEQKQQVLRRVGMAFQQGALFDYMTVAENLTFAMENMTDFSPEVMETRITDLLKTVKLPRTRNMFPYQLSGGMQRRVGVARAIATSPDVAIFDEPTSGLDPVTSTIILNMIRDLMPVGGGKALICSTSSVEVAIRFADRVIMIYEGKVVADGSWRELIVDGPEWVRNFLSVRLIGIDIDYARELGLPERFIKQHWSH